MEGRTHATKRHTAWGVHTFQNENIWSGNFGQGEKMDLLQDVFVIEVIDS